MRSNHFCIFFIILSVFWNNYKITTRNNVKEEKHNKLLYLAKTKLDCIEMLISNSIKDGMISHDKFLEILKEKKNIMV